MTCRGCDLDLVLRQQELPNREEALELLKELANAATPARADVTYLLVVLQGFGRTRDWLSSIYDILACASWRKSSAGRSAASVRSRRTRASPSAGQGAETAHERDQGSRPLMTQSRCTRHAGGMG
jgi:hypothetical protein